jgi:hypothetical protein
MPQRLADPPQSITSLKPNVFVPFCQSTKIVPESARLLGALTIGKEAYFHDFCSVLTGTAGGMAFDVVG